MASKFSVGDNAYLKIGGPIMAVTAVYGLDVEGCEVEVDCCWFDNDLRLRSQAFDERLLMTRGEAEVYQIEDLKCKAEQSRKLMAVAANQRDEASSFIKEFGDRH